MARPKRRVLVIGIGAGNPDHLTVQAIGAMNRADAIFIPDKGSEKADLARIREAICDRFVTRPDVRRVPYAMPARRADADYGVAVGDWHDALAEIFGGLLLDELADGACGAFLVWGDPALYDSTLRILDRLAGAIELDAEVIPGISAVQALAAAHRVPLNAIGQSVSITTGRRLAEGFPDADSVVVMLDGGGGLRSVVEDVDVWWGGNVGTADEVLITGRLRDVLGEIEESRAALRAARGWVMDTALLRRARDRAPS